MTQPRDPDAVEPTLVPDAPATAPAAPRGAPARPAKSTTETPGPFDATIDVPVPSAPALADPGATLPASARTVAPAPAPPARENETGSEPTAGGTEPTLLPSAPPAPAGAPRAAVSGADETGVHVADPAATLPSPAARTVADKSGKAGADTAPATVAEPSGPKLGPSPSATGTMVGRFALKGLHASGGLGEVFTARDTELNREVAVKRIKSHYADDPGSRSRFLSEATLTARLDHPGVVPVFGLVNDVRGRPCYAMRFIRGETLKDEIDRYYGNQETGDRKQETDKTGKTEAGETPSPAPAPQGTEAVPRSVAFRQLLARFIATCQAIAYAHKKNIIHRDIKPANIMVGAFGETLVVDWGLAKSLDDGPDFDRMMKAQAATGFRHDPDATDLPSHMTSAGTAVGTPAYMAPEQAAGDIHTVGPRADVYSLGATLFVVLTGKPPVAGKNTIEVLEHVRRGAYEPAAVVNPECPKPLDAIARKAMALRPEDRYATALELAADVERWLSDEPVSCYRDPALARLARWARRHPAQIAAAVSLLLAGVLAAVGIAVVYQQGEKQTAAQRDLARKAEKEAADERDNVKKAQGETLAANRELENKNAELQVEKEKVEVARNAATKRYDRAVRAYGVLVHDIDKKLAGSIGMENLRRTLLLNATEGLKQLIADEGKFGADRTLVAAYRQMGDVYQRLGNTPQAHENFKTAVDRAREVRKDATSAADKRAADLDLGRSLDRLSGIFMQAGKTDDALKAIDEAIGLFTPYAADPKDTEAQTGLAEARARRSTIKMERGDSRGALKDCAAALAARKSLASQKLEEMASSDDMERQRDFAASLDAMAVLQLRTSPKVVLESDDPEVRALAVGTEAALASAREALARRIAVAKQFPNHPDAAREQADAHARIGEIHLTRGHLTAAADEFTKGLEKLQELFQKDDTSAGAKADLAQMYGRLSHAQLRLGEVEKALTNTELGLKLARELQQADPKSAKARRDLALAHERRGEALLAAGLFEKGLEEYTASEQILRPLHAEDRASARGLLDLARGLERLGDGYVANRNMPGAVVAFEASVKFRREAFEQDPNSASAKRDLATGLYKLADAFCGSGRPGKAEAHATEATDLFTALAKDDPASAQAQRDIALAYGKWGQVLSAGGHLTGALIVWQNSLHRCEKLTQVDVQNVQAQEDEAAAWERLAGFYASVHNPDRALAAARTAVEKWAAIAKGVDAKTKAGRRRLALAMLRVGDLNTEVQQFGDARQWYEKAEQEAAAEASDPLLANVREQARDQQEYLKAVEAGLKHPKSVLTAPEKVRSPALQTVVKLALRTDDVTTAYVAALELVTLAAKADKATKPATTFAAAAALAGCAAARRGDEKTKQEYAEEALAQLELAIAAGFRNAEALADPDWDAVRTRAKSFAKVQKELEALRDAGK